MDIKLPNMPSEDREFATIQLVLNHLQLRKDGHYVQEFVMTTQGPVETLAALGQYYGESHLLATPQALKIIQQAPQSQAAAYVYVSPENIQVIMDADDWAALCERFPTQFAVCDFLAKSVSEAMAAQIARDGSFGKLYVLALDAVEAPVQEQMVSVSEAQAAIRQAVAEERARNKASRRKPAQTHADASKA